MHFWSLKFEAKNKKDLNIKTFKKVTHQTLLKKSLFFFLQASSRMGKPVALQHLKKSSYHPLLSYPNGLIYRALKLT